MAAPLQLSTSTLAKPMAAPLSLGSTVQPGLLSPKSLIAKPTALPGTFATSAKPMAAQYSSPVDILLQPLLQINQLQY